MSRFSIVRDIGAWVVALVIIHVENIASWRASITSMLLHFKFTYIYPSRSQFTLPVSAAISLLFDANFLHFAWNFALWNINIFTKLPRSKNKTSTSVNLNIKRGIKVPPRLKPIKWLSLFSKMNKTVKLSK